MKSTEQWEIEVSAGAYFDALGRDFSSPDIYLIEENDDMGIRHFAYCPHIDELDKPVAVGQRLASFQLLLNGALRVWWGDISAMPIRFTSFTHPRHARGSVHTSDLELCPFADGLTKGRSYSQLDMSFGALLLYFAKEDEKLRSLLFMAGLLSENSLEARILSWGTLYRMTDSIRTYAREIGVGMHEIVDTAALKRFTAACNNMSVLGIYARHGASATAAPGAGKVLTDLGDATKLILEMARSFCAKYLQVVYP